jgi:hypothetical protein
MSTIAIPSPSGVGRWPRAAVTTVVALVVALALTISLAFAMSGHTTTTRTVERPAPAQSEPLACHFGQAC